MSIRPQITLAALVAVVGTLSTSQASAATLYGGNGHYYDYVAANVSWSTALANAAAAAPIAGYQAHLVTIADASEDTFVKTLTGSAQFVWAAGTDAGHEGVWTWEAGPQAGQTFDGPGALAGAYSNWNAAEPNNIGGEDSLHLNSFGPGWNDVNAAFLSGYVVEYSPLPMAPAAYGGNGHLYQVVAENGSWESAVALAAMAPKIPGYASYLVTLTDAGEDAFVKSLLGGRAFVWAGGSDADAEGVWKWATGPEAGHIFYGPGAAAGAYSNWNPFEPNDVGGAENALHLNSFGDHWNDVNHLFSGNGYVVEYSLSGSVPEASTWFLMLLGFGVAGVSMRRRAKAPA